MTARQAPQFDRTALDSLEVSFDPPTGPDSSASVQRNSGRSVRHRLLRSAASVLLLATAASVMLADRVGHRGRPAADGPVVLSMASPYASLDYAPAIQHFVDRAVALSGGAIRINVVDEWGGVAAADVERDVVDAVRAGQADLGWVGTRILDTLGVHSFQALTAPLLVDSYPLQQAVFESGLPDRMLPAVADLSVVGLALLAGGLRRPVAAERALLEPADWRGGTFQTMRSRTQADAVRVLGATPIHPTRAENYGDAFDTSLHIYTLNGLALRAPYVAANVNLWPETTVLLANPLRLKALSPLAQDWLRRAATDAAAASIDLADADADLVSPLCQRGARFATATAAQLAALRHAMAPTYRRLSQDAQTKQFIADIERVKGSVASRPLAVPDGCNDLGPSSRAPAAGSRHNVVLDGAYVRHLRYGDLVSHQMSTADARAIAGTYTLTLHNGRWHLHGTNQDGGLDRTGTYTVVGPRLILTPQPGTEPNRIDRAEPLSIAWALHDGQLFLNHPADTADTVTRMLWNDRPWPRTRRPTTRTELHWSRPAACMPEGAAG